MSKTWAVVPAAGRGLRMGASKPKQFLDLCGKPVLWHTLRVLLDASFLSGVLLAAPEDFFPEAEKILGELRQDNPAAIPVTLVAGGAERQDSVMNALKALPADCGWVLVHDGVRPLVSQRLLEAVWRNAQAAGASIAALPATDTVKRVQGAEVASTLLREEIWLVQTPQVFRRDILIDAYEKAAALGWSGTDDASFVERLGIPVSAVVGDRFNIKVTTPEDIALAEWRLGKEAASC